MEPDLQKLSEDNAKLREELRLLEDRQKEENVQLKHEIECLKCDLASIRALITEVPPLSVTVDRYEWLKRNSDAHISQVFYTHPRGYKMCIKIWPNGVLDGKDSHVSVACHIVQGEHDAELKWPFCGNVHLRLVNQRSDEHHCDHFIRYTRRTPHHLSGRVTRGGETSPGNNLVHFISHAELSNSAGGKYYLLDDKLQFFITKVEVK